MRNHWLSIVLASALLAGCPATMSTGSADVSTQIAYTEVGVQAIVKTCATLVDEKRMTAQQGIDCANKTKSAFSMIDVARGAFKAGNPQTAESMLGSARAVLVELEKQTGVR